MNFNHNLLPTEASAKARKLYETTKGKRLVSVSHENKRSEVSTTNISQLNGIGH